MAETANCGCGHLCTEHRRLACLRLDDMAEFYVGGLGGRSIYKTDIEKIYEELLAGTAKVGEASFVNLRRDICGA